METSDVDNWVPVSEEGADDSEITLTRRNNRNKVDDDLDLLSPLGDPFVPEARASSADDQESKYKERLDVGAEVPKSSDTKDSLRRKSGSSLEAVPLSLKSSPADPHLSDVNSISSKANVSGDKGSALNSVSDIISNSEKESQKLVVDGSQTPSAASNFFDNMMSSLSFKQGSQQATPIPSEASRKTNPPDIITHRRQPSTGNKKFNKKSNSPPETSSPLREVEKPQEMIRRTSLHDNDTYDPKRFVEETYLDTPFHYASPERNAEFHSLFKNVPESDRLLDDFSCALSREFLYQGRLYISESHLCFSSSLLGWIAKVITPFKDVTYMEKTSTAGLFPNAISIETETSKTQFNGFISRDTAFTLLKEVWSRTLLAQGEERDNEPSTTSTDNHITEYAPGNKSYTDLVRPSGPPSRTSYASENDSIIEDAIRSVDDYSSSHHGYDSGLGSDGEEVDEEEDDKEEEISDQKSISSKTKKIGYKLKSKASYDYDGPYYAKPTDFQYRPEDNNETVLAEVELDAPPGVVFQLMFSETNPKFWLEFFKTQDSSQFSEIGQFNQVNQEGQRYREFTYAKGLHFPVGPKSTKCVVRETILHLDYSDYINVLNITRTPDVPSGGSFSTRTRYMFRWASETTCALKISYWVEWTASSWIKSMVESSCRSGQIAATKDLVEDIKKYVEENTEKGSVSVNPSPPGSGARRAKAVKRSTLEKTVKEVVASPALTGQEENLSSTFLRSSAYIVPLLFVVILLLVWNLFNQLIIKRDINRIQEIILSGSAGLEKSLGRGRNSLSDLPAKAHSAVHGLPEGLEKWLARFSNRNTNGADNVAVEQFLKSLEALVGEAPE